MERTLEAALLRSVCPDDADELYELVAENRAYLSRWMPWAAEQTLEGIHEFIASAIREEESGDGTQLALIRAGRIIGVLGLNGVDWQNRSTNLGYWIAEHEQGAGLMTAAVKRLVDHAFGDMGLHRVSIRTAPDNERSRAICKRLGFVAEGRLREAERMGERYNDLVISSVLSSDWPSQRIGRAAAQSDLARNHRDKQESDRDPEVTPLYALTVE